MGDFTPLQRQRQILAWLQEQEALKIRELATRFGVSQMTIHRDVDRLAALDKVQRIRGGIVLPEAPLSQSAVAGKRCALCAKVVVPRLAWRATPVEQPRWYACCSHCGLLQLARGTGGQSVLSADFLYGHMINVYQAWYLIGADLRLCCMPSTLCFGSRSDAERFQQGFGGEVMDFKTALAAMADSHHHH